MSRIAHSPRSGVSLEIGCAGPAERALIYRLRHDVYARELGQHAPNGAGELQDAVDDYNVYLVASEGGKMLGFISITPPARRFSIDKYMAREELPIAFDDGLYEVRLLTVVGERRGRKLAVLLMYAAFRWVEANGGTRILALGREELLGFYRSVGLRTLGRVVVAGAVRYHAMSAGVDDVAAGFAGRTAVLDRLERGLDWRLPVPFRRPAACYHGGAFFEGIGDEFDALGARERVVSADVLDAWFPPSPRVLDALSEHLSWLVSTSPPTDCGGMARVIARARGVPVAAVLPGAGSSDLIFLALRAWLSPASRVLILDPMYGEYAHVLEDVIGCRVDRLELRREDGYALDPGRLCERLTEGYDLVALVNPNSPTGRHVPRTELEHAIEAAPPQTRVWIDETYVEYAGQGESLEQFAVGRGNVVVGKSMSKVYALSGVRAAYLCAAPAVLEPLRTLAPPWAVSLPAQVAAVAAVQDDDYYATKWAETHALRESLASGLTRLGINVVPGATANFLLGHLPDYGPTAAQVVDHCRAAGVFLRDAGAMGRGLGRRALRVAVKDAATNARVLGALGEALRQGAPAERG